MRRNIKLLLSISKTAGKLDPRKIKKIGARLTRAELREYLMLLREIRDKEKVVVETPIEPSLIDKSLVTFFRKRFKDKEIEFLRNKELVGGMRIRTADNTLDYSFKNILEKIYDYD